ncbi:hypothetical protein [Nocardia sp. GAS34]|uniref:hypothetical protein n=1 Tax=unclassified Nocardia TaxID=2637762 RepID=UPI003D1AF451
MHISDVPFSRSSPLPYTPDEADFAWARDHPGQWKYFADGAADRSAVKVSDVVAALRADDNGGFRQVWWNPEYTLPKSETAGLTNDFEVAAMKLVKANCTLGQFVQAFADSDVIVLLPEDDPAGERWPLRASGDEWWLDVYTSPGRLPDGLDSRRQRTVSGRHILEQVCPLPAVRVSFKSGTSPEPEFSGTDLAATWHQLSETERDDPASDLDDKTHLQYLHQVMGSSWDHTASTESPEQEPEPELHTGDLSRLAAREVLHISDKTRTRVKILPEAGERDFAWARANPGEWKYYADPRVDDASLQRRNLIGGRRAGEDGAFAETWLNPDFVPTEDYSGWQFANGFEVVVWRVSFGFNTVGDFIDAFSRSEFILLRSADDPGGEQDWPLAWNPRGDLTLTVYSSAGKLPPDTNPWLRRLVSGRDILEQVCPLEGAWIQINVDAFPYQEFSGANLLRWWREWQAAQSLQATADRVEE